MRVLNILIFLLFAFVLPAQSTFERQSNRDYESSVEGVNLIVPYNNTYQEIPGEIDLALFDVGGPMISYESSNGRNAPSQGERIRPNQPINIEKQGDEEHMISDFIRVDYAVEVNPSRKYLIRLDYELKNVPTENLKEERRTLNIDLISPNGKKFSQQLKLDYTDQEIATLWEVLDLTKVNLSGALKLRLGRNPQLKGSSDYGELHIGKLVFYEYEEPEFDQDLLYTITCAFTGENIADGLDGDVSVKFEQDAAAKTLVTPKEDYLLLRKRSDGTFILQLNREPNSSKTGESGLSQFVYFDEEAKYVNKALAKDFSAERFPNNYHWNIIKLPNEESEVKKRYLLRSAYQLESGVNLQAGLLTSERKTADNGKSGYDVTSAVEYDAQKNDFIIEPVDFNLEQDYSKLKLNLNKTTVDGEAKYDLFLSGVESNSPFKYISFRFLDDNKFNTILLTWNRDFDNTVGILDYDYDKNEDVSAFFPGNQWKINYDNRTLHFELNNEEGKDLISYIKNNHGPNDLGLMIIGITDDGEEYVLSRSIYYSGFSAEEVSKTYDLELEANKPEDLRKKFFESNPVSYGKYSGLRTSDHIIPGHIDLANFDWGGGLWSYRDNSFKNEGDANIRTEESVDIYKNEEYPDLPPVKIGKIEKGEQLFYTIKEVEESGYYLLKLNYTATEDAKVNIKLGQYKSREDEGNTLLRATQDEEVGYYYEVLWLDKRYVNFIFLEFLENCETLELYDLALTTYDYERSYDFFDSWFSLQIGDDIYDEPLCLTMVTNGGEVGGTQITGLQADDGIVIMTVCRSGDEAQQWRFVQTGVDQEGTYFLENRLNGLRLNFFEDTRTGEVLFYPKKNVRRMIKLSIKNSIIFKAPGEC